MIIAGAGGHAREIFDILDAQAVKEICFFDNMTNPLPNEILNNKSKSIPQLF